LRMVCAMFLTKDLLIDWRRGEAFFARYLLDFDLASNNGGWQWSASTGVDAQPYFRIFNPILQSRKFDPETKFITEWCPELEALPVAHRHWPNDAGLLHPEGYPLPIVDHYVQRDKAIALLTVDK
ncbi:MAG: FAD-binding domain-containing protein, partial [Fimbriimonadaceae bacterium]|nr:FAD-binding domain-containing protein [Fimbriimonadaceae bacterium]